MDVRLSSDYAKQHIEGAISVPMFRETAGNEKWDKVKKVGAGVGLLTGAGRLWSERGRERRRQPLFTYA